MALPTCVLRALHSPRRWDAFVALQCNSAIAQLSGGYFGVLTKYAMSCTTTDGVAKKAVMPCPPVSICAGVAPLTTTSVCDPDPTRRLVA